MDDIFNYIFIFLVTLVGETFGTIFGGGSFFVQPGLIVAGVEPKLAVASDIAAACFSSYAYLLSKRKMVMTKIGKYTKIICLMFPSIVIGAYSGAYVLKLLPEGLVVWFIIVIATAGLVKMIFTNINRRQNKDIVSPSSPIRAWPFVAVIAALVLGFYDGLSAAGGGTLQILAFALIFRMHMKELILMASLFTGISLTSASISFFYLGLLDFNLLSVMIPAAFIAGLVASKVTDVVSDKHLEYTFIGVLTALLLYIGADLIFFS